MKPFSFAFVTLAACPGGVGAQNTDGTADPAPRRCSVCVNKIYGASSADAWRRDPINESLSAVYAIDTHLLFDAGSVNHGGTLFGRQALPMARSSSVPLGAQSNVEFTVLGDGDASGGNRQSDNLRTLSANNGVSAANAFGFDEFDTSTARRAWGLSVGYTAGPLTIRAAHQNRNVARVAPATPLGNNMDAKNSTIAFNLKLGAATAYAGYSANRGWGSSPLWNPDNPYSAALASTPSTDSRDVLVGFALPVGATTLLASYIRKNDRDLANRDAAQLAFGASYCVSRRTDFYATWSRIQDRSGVSIGPGRPNLTAASSSALNIGMRHAF